MGRVRDVWIFAKAICPITGAHGEATMAMTIVQVSAARPSLSHISNSKCTDGETRPRLAMRARRAESGHLVRSVRR